MHTYLCTYVYIYVFIYSFLHTYTYIYTKTYVYTSTCICINKYTSIHSCRKKNLPALAAPLKLPDDARLVMGGRPCAEGDMGDF